jgi:hypothetical protein
MAKFVPFKNVIDLPVTGEYAYPILQYAGATLDPDFAEYIARFNTHNRRKRKGHITVLAEKAKEGLLHQAFIPFAWVEEAKQLSQLDAQHLCDAVRLVETPLDVTICVFRVPTWKDFGILFSQYNVVEKRRTLDDFVWLVLRRLRLDEPILYYVKIARGLAYFKHGGRYSDTSLGVLDRAELLAELPGLRQRLMSRFYGDQRGPGSAAERLKLCRPPIMAAYLAGAKEAKCSRACWEEFWDEFLLGIASPGRPSPGRKLRNVFRRSDVGGGKPREKAAYYLTGEQFRQTTLHMAECHGKGKYGAPVQIIPQYGRDAA